MRYKDDVGVIRAAYSPAEDHVRSFAELSKLVSALSVGPPQIANPEIGSDLI